MATKDSNTERESTKPSADGDNNYRNEGGQGDNGSVKKIANVPVTQLENVLRKIYDDDSDRFRKLSVAEIRREMEKRLSLPDRTLKKANGLLALIEQFDNELTKKEKSRDKDKEREKREKERERKEKEKERERDKNKTTHSSDRDRKSSHRSSQRKSSQKKRKRSSDSYSDSPKKNRNDIQHLLNHLKVIVREEKIKKKIQMIL